MNGSPHSAHYTSHSYMCDIPSTRTKHRGVNCVVCGHPKEYRVNPTTISLYFTRAFRSYFVS